ncbi:survival motor neuron interacting protein 1-domain-containing protein [Chytridium lagenaria]|nr:survival motor neuron interacting protein 1-domain-containing protein [Chytridium lagenaria]
MQKRRGGGGVRGSKAAPDDDDVQRRRGLPIDDYAEANDPLPSGLPSSGLEYLRMVRMEAELCPQVVRASLPTHIKSEAQNPSIPDLRLQYFGNALEEAPSLPRHLRASPYWIHAFLGEFNELRAVFADRIREQKKKKKKKRKDYIQWALVLPSSNDKPGVWKTFCYGVEDSKAFSKDTNDTLAMETKDDASALMDDEEEGEVMADVSLARAIGRVGTGFDVEEPMPLLNITAAMDHESAINLLQNHIQWIRNDDITPFQVQWVLALLLRLETPLFSEHVSTLRDLCRKCQKVRSQMIKCGKIPSEPFDTDSHPAVIGLRVIVTIITGYFGQKDLSDDVADRPTSAPAYDEGLSDVMESTMSL